MATSACIALLLICTLTGQILAAAVVTSDDVIFEGASTDADTWTNNMRGASRSLLQSSPLTPCVNEGFGKSATCAGLPKPSGYGCACGSYIGGTVSSGSVCQANAKCSLCKIGCNTDANCPLNYNCAGGCGGAPPPIPGYRGVCLPNCGLAQPAPTTCGVAPPPPATIPPVTPPPVAPPPAAPTQNPPTACPSTCTFANATPRCTVSGSCTLSSCNTGFGNCDVNSANGCEINLTNDVNHCGSCSNSCSFPNAAASCVGSACVMGACNPGFADCDNNPVNGCEVNTNSGLTNCGACNAACGYANAGATCSAGTCALGTCNAGFANCDTQSANGCEVDTSTDVSNCGTCGNTCAFPNAAGSCVGGTCVMGACNAGFANCDGQAANGCEVNTDTELGNCGGCGVTCAAATNAVASCSAGTCNPAQSCNEFWFNCDGNAANGCETAYFAATSNTAARTSCDCPAGTGGTGVPGSTSCNICQAGSYSPGGPPATSPCYQCPDFYISANFGAATCTPCPPGYGTNLAGTRCVACQGTCYGDPRPAEQCGGCRNSVRGCCVKYPVQCC